MVSEAKSKPPKVKTTTILVNNRPVEVEDRKLTGAGIKAAAGIPPNFKLYDDRGREIGDGEQIKVHEKQKFTAISGQDVS